MKGYHIYYKFSEDDDFECLNHLILLLSIKSWKKYFGQINLLCNTKYLESISRWGIDSEYTEINTDYLKKIPFENKISEFFSFPKIYGCKIISERNEPFAIIDTDLWIDKPFPIPNLDILFYHAEIIKDGHPNNPYIDKNLFIDNGSFKNYNWDKNPINTSLVFFNKNFNNIINEWYDFSVNFINSNFNLTPNDIDKNKLIITDKALRISKMMFIEQRALSEIISQSKLNVDFIFHSCYLPFEDSKVGDGREWFPNPLKSEKLLKEAELIKHIWGEKSRYTDPIMRNFLIELINWKYEEILDDKDKLKYQNLINEVNKL